MFTTTEEDFIELKLQIKDKLEEVKKSLNHISIRLENITHYETILEIKEELLGISFHLSINNKMLIEDKDMVINIILGNIIGRIEKMYLKEVK